MIDGCVLCITVSTEEALEMLRPESKDERIVRGGSVHQNCAREFEPDV